MAGKVVIVSGSAAGARAGLVASYRGQGWAVVSSAGPAGPSEDPDVLTVAGDIAEPGTADRIVSRALDRFGRIDTLVITTDVVIGRLFTDTTDEDYARVVGASLAGFFLMTRRVIAEMAIRYGGHVITVMAARPGTADGPAPVPVLAALVNGGLAAATRSLAGEYAPYGIRVNAVSADAHHSAGHPQSGDAGPVPVSDIVGTVLYLESAPGITGEILRAGGRTASQAVGRRPSAG